MSTTYLKFLLEVMAQTVAAPDTQADLMEGSDGNDTLVGDAGSDALFGGSDKDLIVGGAGDDHLFGDMVAGSVAFSDWRIDRMPLTGSDGSAAGTRLVFTGIDYQTAARQEADVLLGGAGSDYLLAQGGDDYLDGGTGNDYLIGGSADADKILGLGGNDVVSGDERVHYKNDSYLRHCHGRYSQNSYKITPYWACGGRVRIVDEGTRAQVVSRYYCDSRCVRLKRLSDRKE